MIIEGPDQVTPAVLAEIARAPNPRFREVMTALVKHLHAFVREAKLTEEEFHQGCAIVNAIGQNSNAFHNEAVLMSGSLGVSTLVCLLNNGKNGATETTANLLGPFWRLDSPRTENGGSIVRSPTPGPELFVNAWAKDRDGKPVVGAEVDIWQSSTEGFYENQDPTQADMNLRGKFTTDADGHIAFRSIKPAGYPIPIDGPVGDLLKAQGRHNMRPAHLHFLIYKDGLQDPHLAGLSAGRSEHRHRRAVRRDAAAAGRLRPPREREGAGARREGPVVLARLHLHHGAGHGEAAARADPGQGDDHRDAAAVSAGGQSSACDGEVIPASARRLTENFIAKSESNSRDNSFRANEAGRLREHRHVLA